MRYSTIVDKSEETLNQIIAKAEEFDQERVLNGLSMRHYTLADVQMLRSHVEEYHAKLRKEIVSLVAFAQDFNQQYATDNNKCFDTASQLFNRIRSSIAGQMNRQARVCKLSARYVAMLMQWCGITGTGKEKQFVEEYFNHTYQGRYQTLSSSSVNAAKNRFTAKQYADFCQQLTEIISPGQQQRPKLRVVD